MGNNTNYADTFRGCLIGGAAGDALGYPIEFLRRSQIEQRYGTDGLTHYQLSSNGLALISDDTQMTLFTATGLLTGITRLRERGIAGDYWGYIGYSYTTWGKMQMGQNPRNEWGHAYSWLADVPEMGEWRAPGNTCMSVLRRGEFGTIDDPINDSKGCGGVMRVAPIGLFLNRDGKESQREYMCEVAAQTAALTHGHELGWLPAVVLVYIINALTYTSTPLIDCVREAQDYVQGMYGDRAYWGRLQESIDSAVRLAANNERDIDNIRALGQGWVAEETLAIALYCAIKYEHDFSKALCAAVNHDGDSDSTGAVTGNILGAIWGYNRIPQQWKEHLECKDLIVEIADDLYAGYEGVSGEKTGRYM